MMKVKKCPYCGKRISYVSAFASRRKGEFVCERCGKESKIIINSKIFLAFACAAVISLVIMAVWIFAGLINNPLGILLVAVPLIIFAALSPKFLYYEPLKKYKKSMEAKKAGIAYSDNLVTSELEENDISSFGSSLENSGKFQLNTEVFNKIRAERTAAREKLKGDELVSNSADIIKTDQEENYVHIIKDVSQNHSYSDAPLKKIHSENPRNVSRTHHYINDELEPDLKENEKKSDGNRYSANRKF